jgi:hypothetical protein
MKSYRDQARIEVQVFPAQPCELTGAQPSKYRACIEREHVFADYCLRRKSRAPSLGKNVFREIVVASFVGGGYGVLYIWRATNVVLEYDIALTIMTCVDVDFCHQSVLLVPEFPDAAARCPNSFFNGHYREATIEILTRRFGLRSRRAPRGFAFGSDCMNAMWCLTMASSALFAKSRHCANTVCRLAVGSLARRALPPPSPLAAAATGGRPPCVLRRPLSIEPACGRGSEFAICH